MDNWLRDPEDRLADELFLIAHDDYSGKTGAATNLLEAALAGAALGELLLDRRISVVRGEVSAADHRVWHEPVTDRILGEIIHRGDGHAVRSWIAFLAPQLLEQVGDRLASAGTVRRETSRGLSLRTTVRWPGVDPNRVARPRIRLTATLERSDQPLDRRTTVLASLVHSIGMTRVLNLRDKSTLKRISAARRLLPPDLADLLSAVEAGMSANALSVRR